MTDNYIWKALLENRICPRWVDRMGCFDSANQVCLSVWYRLVVTNSKHGISSIWTTDGTEVIFPISSFSGLRQDIMPVLGVVVNMVRTKLWTQSHASSRSEGCEEVRRIMLSNWSVAEDSNPLTWILYNHMITVSQKPEKQNTCIQVAKKWVCELLSSFNFTDAI